MSYGYDLAGNPTSVVYPGSRTLTRGFDDAGRFTTSTDWNTLTTTFGYDEDSNLTTIDYPTGDQTDTYTVDNADRITGIDMTAGATTLASLDYTRDDNGQLTGEDLTILPGADSTYDYDPLERLTELNAAATWDYDDADNLLTTATGVDQVFNVGNQLCSTAPTAGTCTTPAPGATTYTYDNRGNRTTITPPSPAAATTLGYDQADRLISVDTADAAYSYNADGLRAAKTVAGDTTTFTWDKTGGLPMLLVESLEGVDTHYLYGPGGQAYAEIGDDGTTTRYLHHDQIGSTRLITNPTGTAVATATYDAYGTPTHTAGTQSHLGYTGQYTDTETGYQYLRARYYDPTTGQFLTVDPLAAVTGERYGYVAGSPTNAADPSGLYCVTGVRGHRPDGSEICRGPGEAASAAAQQAWEHRGTIATVVAGVTCVVATGGVGTAVCVGASAAALAVRSHQAIEQQGWQDAKGDIAVDALLTTVTLGMVGAPASVADDGYALLGYSKWSLPRVAARLGSTTPDAAGLLTQCDVRQWMLPNP